MCSIGKLLLLTLNEREEKVIDKIIAAISDYIRLEPMQIAPVSILSFRGLEIRQHQRKVFQDGQAVSSCLFHLTHYFIFAHILCHI